MFVKSSKIARYLFPSLVWKKKKEKEKKVWLTFDDGPDPLTTPLILSILKKKKIKATFFLIGKKIEEFPELFDDIKKEGHAIGNHSYSHKNGWLTSNRSYVEDFYKCQKFMPKNILFRPPYGKINFWQIRKLKKYKLILWDILSRDYIEKNPNKVKNNVVNNLENGSIIVFHNNKKSLSNIKEILEVVIINIKNKGFKFSTTW